MYTACYLVRELSRKKRKKWLKMGENRLCAKLGAFAEMLEPRGNLGASRKSWSLAEILEPRPWLQVLREAQHVHSFIVFGNL